MSAPLLYITGTNTGVGKTTLATLLLARARDRNIRVVAMKPFCSGGREDAERLHALLAPGLSLNEVNPFCFEAPISPYVAARNENRNITLDETVATIGKIQSRNLPLLIEGAGGLLSPLGERFTLLDVIREIPGHLCIVGMNVLGVINSALLTHRALDSIQNLRAKFILMNPPQPDASTDSNAAIIADWTGVETLQFPHVPEGERASLASTAIEVIDSTLDWWLANNSLPTEKGI
jgi:dethiobiotin synthetase